MDALQRLKDSDAVKRLAERDPTLFSDQIDMRQKIMQRLGWTDLATAASGRLPLVTNLAKALVDEGASNIVLLGMGGSSLAALTISRTIGSAIGMPELHVLDTTSPLVVDDLMKRLDPIHTFFLISSKSGTTIEPLSLYAIFRQWMERVLERPAAGKHFIAITDPKTPLEKLRQREVMRVALSAPATVGGRFSALSMFGLTPAALIGVDLEALVASAKAMQDACREEPEDNPGALLAAFMVDAYEGGRDKLTLACSPRYRSFGLWVEQLVAESTGKEGKGIVPVVEHSFELPLAYDDDRMVIVMRGHDDAPLIDWAIQASAAHPLMEFVLDEPEDIGAEFVRWEHAIALVGHLMGINPFDEPNVSEAKETTNKVLDGTADIPAAIADIDGAWVTYAGGLAAPPEAPTDPSAAMRPLVSALEKGDYVAILAYVPEEEEYMAPLQEAASHLSRVTKRAVCLENGPRYLHSTGQLHKGGPNKGVFLVITARDHVDVPIPDKPFGLAQLHRAQAEGDLATLAAHDRRVMRVDLPETTGATIKTLADAMTQAANEEG